MGDKIVLCAGSRPVPEAEYKARIIKLEKKPIFKNRDCYEIHFLIVEGEYKDEIVRFFANASYKKFSARTKMYDLIKTAYGEDFDDDTEIELDTLKEKIYLIQTVNKTSKKTKNVFSNVLKVIRVVGEL